MGERCDYFQSRSDITGCFIGQTDDDSDFLRCLRPADHCGPHLVQRGEHQGRTLVAWQVDTCPSGTCDMCDTEDSEDDYTTVTMETALRMRDEVDFDPWS